MNQTLHQVARVTIADATLKEQQKPLNPKRRKELQSEAIIALIKRKPVGTRITLDEFQAATGHNHISSVHNLIQQLLEQKHIYRDSLTHNNYHYWIDEPGTVKVVKPATLRLTPSEVKDKAMHWAWEHPNFDGTASNNLHEFIEYLQTLS